MVELIVFIVLLASILGIIFILLKKIPTLVQFPQRGQSGLEDFQGIKNIKGRIGEAYSDFFEKQMLLHRFLSKLKIMVLKIERYIDTILHGIRKKTQEVKKGKKKKISS